jgi:hypothetical protein
MQLRTIEHPTRQRLLKLLNGRSICRSLCLRRGARSNHSHNGLADFSSEFFHPLISRVG